jgi:hypothetical protein
VAVDLWDRPLGASISAAWAGQTLLLVVILLVDGRLISSRNGHDRRRATIQARNLGTDLDLDEAEIVAIEPRGAEHLDESRRR